ncbi:MAG TPA: PstS family phosphate ABC transporter substrate-binding protein [Bdellovibrionales bacterium]|nr:PstS family phosphate ABC transporter substrate-binding protein [Bdellovibrionales bacterium]
MRFIALFAVLVSTAILQPSVSFGQATTIKIDGSSTVFPITEAVAEEFQTAQRGKVRVTVGISGTGGGFKKFCRGETDVQNASRPIQATEIADCKKAGVAFFELPVAFDATAIVVNPKNTWLKSITVEELKKLWEPAAQGKITKWSQVNPAWPDQPIKLFGAGSDSGTFDYFTEAVVGKAKSSRGDYTASEDDNTLVQGIANDKNALGYLPLAYVEENKAKLKVVPVVGGDKSPKKTAAVEPSRATVEDGSYFPLSRPIFIYVNQAASKRAEVADFTTFYLANSAQLVPEVKYVPLPAKAYEMAKERFNKGKVGTIFGGHSEVGLKIEELLKRESKM